MERKCNGTWHDDPAHFRRPTRRTFLHVGLVGALGLSLDQFFRLQARAAELVSPSDATSHARHLENGSRVREA